MYNTSNNCSMNDYLYFDGLSDYDIMIGALDKDDDILDGKSTAKYNGSRKTGRAYRRSSGKRKDKKRKNVAAMLVPFDDTMWLNWKFIDGEWFQVGKYLKYHNRSNTKKCLKRQSNKKVRNFVDICGKGNAYRRAFEYKWQLF